MNLTERIVTENPTRVVIEAIIYEAVRRYGCAWIFESMAAACSRSAEQTYDNEARADWQIRVDGLRTIEELWRKAELAGLSASPAKTPKSS